MTLYAPSPAAAGSFRQTHSSICRLCLAYCPIEVEVQDGRAVKVSGDRSGTPWNGYICPKGRALPEQHASRRRLLRPVARGRDGHTHELDSANAVSNVAARLRKIVSDHGPEAVAFYIGTGVVSNPTGQTTAVAFMRAGLRHDFLGLDHRQARGEHFHRSAWRLDGWREST